MEELDVNVQKVYKVNVLVETLRIDTSGQHPYQKKGDISWLT